MDQDDHRTWIKSGTVVGHTAVGSCRTTPSWRSGAGRASTSTMRLVRRSQRA